ncbi:hypothetical protein [Hymenobacter arizonensis]|uniref:hypothetical protein n=1 Tax=Hymenobacter arizonensis TaxID=1227077 RepID=UPI0011605D17|nr:hypothetical protein [Hymenobacter arizonensis]
MSRIYAFATAFLFLALSTSLMRLQLVASPVYKMRVPTYRSTSIAAPVIAQNTQPVIKNYN